MKLHLAPLFILGILPTLTGCGNAGGTTAHKGAPAHAGGLGGSGMAAGSASVVALGGSRSAGSGGSNPRAQSENGGTSAATLGSGGTVGAPTQTGPCAASGLFLCDDFESAVPGGPPDPNKWTVDLITSQGIAVDGSLAHSGANSVKVLGTGYRAFLRPKTGLPVANNSFFLRVFLRSSSPMGSGHSTYVEAGKNAMDDHELRVGYHYKMLEVNLMPGDPEQLSSGRDYDDGTPGLSFLPDTWYCLEVHFDGQNQEARVWVDDQEILPLHVTNWNPNMKDGFQNRMNWSPTYASVGIGYEKYSGDPATLWYDDLALGTERIGCR